MINTLIIPYLSNLKTANNTFSINTAILKRKKYDLTRMNTLPIFKETGFFYKIIFFLDQEITLTFISKKQYALWKKLLLESVINSDLTMMIKENITSSKKLYSEKVSQEFLRDSSIDMLNTEISPLMKSYRNSKEVWKLIASETEIDWLDEHCLKFPLKQDHIDYLREWYTKRILQKYDTFFNSVESNPLTQNQRLACIRNNDRNMVLAAAGTGKTSVVVAKALDLIINQKVNPRNILILAYNKKAAEELDERFKIRGEKLDLSQNDSIPTISTFHALGLKIIRDAKIPSVLSKFSDDPLILKNWISDWLTLYLTGDDKQLQNFLATLYNACDPFTFENSTDYERHLRDNEYRTLNKILVKGYQELLIGNWLFSNNIKFEYEPNYIHTHKIDHWHSYRPDFKIYRPDGSSIYLEHFGIDRAHQTRPDIDSRAYLASMEDKRKLHRDTGTTLIETYHYDWKEENLLPRLEALLKENGIFPNPLSKEVIIQCLTSNNFISESVHRLNIALSAIRVSMLRDDEIIERLNDKKIANAKAHANILIDLHQSYCTAMRNEGTIDFDDMILLATEATECGNFTPTWTHILIDEFQDISESRMSLVKQLIDKGPNPILTVVGDDWQSIYRFAGGRLELTTRFNDYVGSYSKTILDKTFRYNNSIANTAGTFIMQNPEQYHKSIETHTIVTTPQVILLDDTPIENCRLIQNIASESRGRSKRDKTHLEEKTLQTVLEIRQEDPSASIAILSRYNFHLANIKHFQRVNNINIGNADNIHYWSLHGSKGLEADYCIIIGISQGRLGFPSENKDHEVVEALLPTLDNYQYSEERRLFYVGLTRARKRSYLISNALIRSSFITELMTPSYQIEIRSKSFNDLYQKIFKCPKCTDGAFVEYSGTFGAFYSCTTGSGCGLTARLCPTCSAPYVVQGDRRICQNDNCGSSEKLCPKCGRPLRLRSGKFGKFLGCSGYGIQDDQCTYTEKYYG